MNNTSLGKDNVGSPWNPVFVSISVACYSLIIVISLLGNSLVCLAICLNKSLRSSPAMSFIFSLAFCDLLTAAFAMPFDAESLLLNSAWKHGEILCIVWTTTYLFSVPTSILTLLVLTIDRYKTLSDPLRRFRKSIFLSIRSSRFVVGFLWCYSLAFCLLPVMGWRRTPHYVVGGYCNFNITVTYSVVTNILHFILPLLIIGVIYFKIYNIAQNVKQCHELGGGTNSFPSHITRHPTSRDQRRFKRNLRGTKTIASIVCALFICWLPYSVTSTVFGLCKTCFLKSPRELSIVLLMLGYLNSALNPFIYSLGNRKFKDTYRILFRSLRKITRNAQRRSRASSKTSDSSISGRHHVSVIEQARNIRLTSFTVSVSIN
ncbi:histamine H2 receptor-like [Stylophora pistillata]|uniref:histamine H2 receptor-like n=1 Tax=Stylophora pistillata TaxID=50429 RepID=UPI000C056649|nr:histamine H2 receptor-like [Stylophora pistillata]